MATKRRILLPSISGIVPSSAIGTVGTFDLPVGYRYHQIQLVYIDGGASPGDIITNLGDITVFRNTKQQRIHTAAELDHLNGLNNPVGTTVYNRQQVNTAANMRQTLTVYFNEPWRKDKADSDLLAWNVDKSWGWNTFQIKIQLAVAMPATGSIIAYALVDDVQDVPKAGPFQPIVKAYRQQIPASGTGNDVTSGLDQSDAYQVIAMKNPTGTSIKAVTLKRNGVLIADTLTREDNVGALINADMNPANSTTAGAYGFDLVLDADDPVNSALVGSGQNLWMHIDYLAAASGNVIANILRLGNFD